MIMSMSEEMPANSDDLDRLLQKAGPRVRPPDEMAEQVRAAIHAEWLQMVAARQRRRRFVQVAIAAGLGAVALSVWLLNQAPPAPAVVVAGIERALGSGTVHSADSTRERPLLDRQQLYGGDTLSTGDEGSVSIRMQNVSVRLDHDSSLQLTAQDEVRITSGALYIDSGL